MYSFCPLANQSIVVYEGRGLSRRNDSKGGDSLIQMGLGLRPRPIRIKESPLFRRFSLTEQMASNDRMLKR